MQLQRRAQLRVSLGHEGLSNGSCAAILPMQSAYGCIDLLSAQIFELPQLRTHLGKAPWWAPAWYARDATRDRMKVRPPREARYTAPRSDVDVQRIPRVSSARDCRVPHATGLLASRIRYERREYSTYRRCAVSATPTALSPSLRLCATQYAEPAAPQTSVRRWRVGSISERRTGTVCRRIGS